jgi:hypothetical protein
LNLLKCAVFQAVDVAQFRTVVLLEFSGSKNDYKAPEKESKEALKL